MLVLLATLAAFLVDFFALGALFARGRTYVGFILIFFLMRQRREGAAVASAILYGVLLDLVTPSLPFGTFLAAHVLVVLAFSAVAESARGADFKRSALALSGALVGYGFALSLAAHVSAALFTGIESVFDGTVVWGIALSSALTLAVSALGIWCFRLVESRVQRWFFLT